MPLTIGYEFVILIQKLVQKQQLCQICLKERSNHFFSFWQHQDNFFWTAMFFPSNWKKVLLIVWFFPFHHCHPTKIPFPVAHSLSLYKMNQGPITVLKSNQWKITTLMITCTHVVANHVKKYTAKLSYILIGIRVCQSTKSFAKRL